MKLHVFNPENDLALADFGKNFIPPRSAVLMRDDLAVLPLWWATEGDGILVPYAERAAAFAQGYGSLVPAVEWVSEAGAFDAREVCPWGWSPMLVCQMCRQGCPDSLLPDEDRMKQYKVFSGRRQAVDMLAWLRDEAVTVRQWHDRLCGLSHYCSTEDEIRHCLSLYPSTILKAPWSGSGKGLRMGKGGYVPPLEGWCRRLLKEQGGVVVEPLYRRRFDFAHEFYVEPDRVVYKGLSVFSTTLRGTYGGNWVAPESVKEKWLAGYVPADMQADLRQAQSEWLFRHFGGRYKGWIGIDMMCCASGPGADDCLVHPCVEINLRRTMGVVALDLYRYVSPGSQAYFSVDYEKGQGVLLADHQMRQKEQPLCLSGGRVRSGYVALTPVGEETRYRATLHVVEGDLSGHINVG